VGFLSIIGVALTSFLEPLLLYMYILVLSVVSIIMGYTIVEGALTLREYYILFLHCFPLNLLILFC